MPKITIGEKTIDAPADKRLVLAIEDSGMPILHRCGGYAKCTTCRVSFSDGEPDKMTAAEKKRLESEPNLMGEIRLSCQILCEHDMTVEALMTLDNSDVSDAGRRPEDQMTPDAEWVSKD